MTDPEPWADYYLELGRKDGRLEGLFYGGCCGLIAGMLISFLLVWIWR